MSWCDVKKKTQRFCQQQHNTTQQRPRARYRRPSPRGSSGAAGGSPGSCRERESPSSLPDRRLSVPIAARAGRGSHAPHVVAAAAAAAVAANHDVPDSSTLRRLGLVLLLMRRRSRSSARRPLVLAASASSPSPLPRPLAARAVAASPRMLPRIDGRCCCCPLRGLTCVVVIVERACRAVRMVARLVGAGQSFLMGAIFDLGCSNKMEERSGFSWSSIDNVGASKLYELQSNNELGFTSIRVVYIAWHPLEKITSAAFF